MQQLRQSSPTKFHVGPGIATGGLAAVTTLKASNVTALRIIRHGATVVVSVTGANMFHVSGGHYYVPLTSVHTNTLGHFRLYVRASGTVKSLPFWKDAVVVPQNVYDSLVSSSAKLNVGSLATAGIVWTANSRLLTSGLAVERSTWLGTTVRTLSSGSAVWAANTRTLSSGASVASSVWARSVRLLTSGASVASSVWVRSARTLTSAAAVWTPVLAEPVGVPPAAPQAGQAMMWLYVSSRNGRTVTATGDQVKNAASTVIARAPITTTSTTFTRRPYA